MQQFKLVLFFLLAISGCSTLLAADDEVLTKDQYRQAVRIHERIETLVALGDHLDGEVSRTRIKEALDASAVFGGRVLSLEELEQRIQAYERDDQPGLGKRIAGFFTFLNIVLTLASLMLVSSVYALFMRYILPLLMNIPGWCYEVLVYAVSFALMFMGDRLVSGSASQFVALPGCLGLIGAIFLSQHLHDLKSLCKKYGIANETVVLLGAFTLAAVWLPTAVLHQSKVIGFMTVLAIEIGLGFTAAVGPFCVMIGFKNETLIPRTVAVSFLLMCIDLGIRLTGIEVPHYALFSTGMLFLGTFVYFLGLLIVASGFYPHKNKNTYRGLQVLTVLSGTAAVFIGSVYGVSVLNGIAGTFFALYLIEKYMVVAFRTVGNTWATLGLSGLLYGTAMFARHYPEYFLFV